jgi:hypothetical protein
VEAEAGREPYAAFGCVVAAWAFLSQHLSISKRNHFILTTSFVAVRHASRRAIVPRADNSFLLDNYASNSPLHAITPQSCEIGKLHKVLVPARSQPRFVREI